VLLGLSTEHQVGLAVTAGAFIVFALASSFLFPRFRPQFPGNGLLAFVVVCFVFFFGMLAAVEVFGVEESEGGEEHVAQTETGGEQPTTVQRTTTQQQTSTEEPETTTQQTSTKTVEAAAKDIDVTESEFKIAMPATLKAGKYTFEVDNEGKLPHDLAIKGGKKTELIDAGAKAELTVDLAPGKYHFYCSVPGHEQAGMKVDVTVS